MKYLSVVRSWGFGSSLIGLLSMVGCGEERVPVGSEGNALNAGQCFGESTKCSPPPQGTRLEALEPAECDATPVGALPVELKVPARSLSKLAAASDGTVWGLGKLYDGHSTTLAIEHFSADGTSLGRNDNVLQAGEHTLVEADLTATPGGGAALFAYTIYAATADDDLVERATVLHFDAEAKLTQAPIEIAGMSKGRIAAAADGGSVTIAANAAGNAQQGRLVRVTSSGAPVFIQPNLPTNGQGIGVGMSGFVLDPKNRATVLSERSRDFERDESTFGLARYDEDGNLLGNWLLPAKFGGGYEAMLAQPSADGPMVVQGPLRDRGNYVFGYSPDGDALFAWHLPDGEPTLVSLPETGAVLAGAGGSAILLAPDGSSCRTYTAASGFSGGSPVVIGDHLYVTTGDELVRMSLASVE